MGDCSSQPQLQTRQPKKVLLPCLAFLIVGAFAALHVSTWPTRLEYPSDWSSIEGMLLAEALHLRQGIPIYAPASADGFDAANYGPLYYLLGARLVNPAEPSYLPLRIASLLATLGCAAGCALLAFWVSGSRLAAGLAPLMFVGQAMVTYYGASARCDAVALFLFFCGFLIAYRFRHGRAILLGAPFMLLGFYYKQHFLAGPLAVFVFLLLEKRYRLAAAFAGIMTIGATGLLALFQFAIFPNEAFFRHFVTYNALPYSPLRFLSALAVFALLLLVPLLVGLEFLRQNPDKLLTCYLLGAVVLAIVPTGRMGSDTNYFLECALVLSALFPALLATRMDEPARARELSVLLIVSLLLGQLFTPSPPRAEDFTRDRAVQAYLRENFPAGTEGLSYYTGQLVRAGLKAPIANLFHYSWLIRQGMLPERDFLNQLEQRRYGLILVNYDLRQELDPSRPDSYLPDTATQAILRNYRLETCLEMPAPGRFNPEDRFCIWVPQAPEESSAPASSGVQGSFPGRDP